MAVPLFLVVLDEEIPENVLEKAKAICGEDNIYTMSGDTLLLRSPIESPVALRDRLDIGMEGHRGVVFKLNGSYGGFYSASLWDWLKEGRDE